jgi:hypothetical protein
MSYLSLFVTVLQVEFDITIKYTCKILHQVPKAQAEPICTDCKKFMNDIKNQVTSAATEKEIEQMLEKNLCAMMGPLAEECKSLVEAYVPELMELLTGEFVSGVML